MHPPLIHLTAPTGALGSRTLHHLLHTLNYPSTSLQLSSSSPSPSLPRTTPPLRCTNGDFLAPETLTHTFPNHPHTLLLISYPSIAHDLRVRAHTNAVDAAIAAGVQWIVYTSLAFAGDSEAAVMRAHVDTEEYLKRVCAEKGVRWTVIREGIYSESWELYLGGVAGLDWEGLEAAGEEGKREVSVPKGSKDRGVAWVGRDELGEGTARVLADVEGKWYGKTVLFSGRGTVSLEGVAGVVAGLKGWDGGIEVREVEVGGWVEEQVERKLRGGGDEAEVRELVRAWASTYPAIARGELDVVDPCLQEVLGEREFRGFEEVVKETLAGPGEVRRYAK